MESVCVWLADRLDLQLHTYQLKTLIQIVKVKTEDWQDKRATRSLARSFTRSGRLTARGLFFVVLLFFSFLFSAKTSFNAPIKKKYELKRV